MESLENMVMPLPEELDLEVATEVDVFMKKAVEKR